MELSDKLIEAINETTLLYGQSFGPSLVSAILYGPSGVLRKDPLKGINRFPLEDECIQILLDREKQFPKLYNRILSSYSQITHAITDNSFAFPNRNKLASKLKIRPFDDIKKKLGESIRGEFKLDKETRTNLFEGVSKKNEDVKFYIDDSGKYVLMIKIAKSHISQMQKYESYWFKGYQNGDNRPKLISESQRKNFNHFLARNIADPSSFWSCGTYKDFKKKYGVGIVDKLQLADLYYSATIIDLNYERGMNRCDKLATIGTKLNFEGFQVVEDRFDDHRKIRADNFPGGIDYTIVPLREQTLPIEVRYWTNWDAIMNFCGPENWPKYASSGKKGNPKYKGRQT